MMRAKVSNVTAANGTATRGPVVLPDQYEWTDHAIDQIWQRFYGELTQDGAKEEAFERAVRVSAPRKDKPGRWDPLTGALFITRWDHIDQYAVIVTVICEPRSPLGKDFQPECPVCGIPAEPGRHDPCPWCDDYDAGRWRSGGE